MTAARGQAGRAGFLAVPRAWRELGRAHLEPAQRALLDDLAEAAGWEPAEVTVPGLGVVRLDVGEALVTSRNLAKSSGLSRDQVRRALARFEALGLVQIRPAEASEAAPHAAPPPAPPAAPHAAPPPTVVRVRKFREIFWPSAEAAPPPAPSPAPPAAPEPAPIQQEQSQPEPEGSSPSARTGAPQLVLATDAEPAPPSPHQRAVRSWVEGWERAGRGKHPTLTGAEGAAIKHLVAELGVDELVARFGRAFSDPWFLEHGDLLTFRRQVGKFAPPGRPGPAAAAAQPPVAAGPWRDLVDRVRREGPPGWADRNLAPLRPRRCGDRLELLAPPGFPVAFLAGEWGAALARWVEDAFGEPLQVDLVEQGQAAAGGTR